MRERRIVFKKAVNVRVWSAAEKECVRDMYREGYGDAEIGEKLGRSVQAVGLQRHFMGLHKAKQPGREFVIHDAMADYYPA